MNLSEVFAKLGQPVPYYASLAPIFGGVKCAIFFCRFAWWHGLQADPDGWIYKTQAEITGETGLSDEEQACARRKLKELGVIEEQYKRIEHRLYYRINFDRFEKVLMAIPSRQNQSPESEFSGFGNTAFTGSSTPEKPESSNSTEKTQKRLTEGSGKSGFVGSSTNPIPTIEEISTEMRRQIDKIPEAFKDRWKPDAEAELFHAHFSSNGWKIGGKTRMRSWESATVTWRGRFIERQTTSASRSFTPSIQRQAIEDAINNHPANPKSIRYQPNCSEALKVAYRDLKEKLRKLNEQAIASV